MTTRVTIENSTPDGHDVEIYTRTVETLAGSRRLLSEQKYCTLKPGDKITVYLHMCQDLRIVEKPH